MYAHTDLLWNLCVMDMLRSSNFSSFWF